MARIAVVTSHPPFSVGGHLVIARELETALRAAGHEATVTYTPHGQFNEQASAYWATWLTDLAIAHDGHRVDQVISLRYPSYAIRHPVHVCWLNHRMREYYDLWERFSNNLSWRARAKQHVRRRLIHAGDQYLLTRNVTRVFAQSKTIQKRLTRWGGIPSEVIYPPAPKRSYRCDDYEDYLFVVSRLTPLKRIDLIINALAHPDAVGVNCLIGGDGEDRGRLQSLIEARGLENRVTLLGQLDESTLINHYARCRAVCYPPLQEDYGFVTVEAFSASKPIITCTDSGGPTELVQSGVSGLITEPTSVALASAIGTLMADRSLAQKYGAAGRHFADSLSWDQTLRQLLIV